MNRIPQTFLKGVCPKPDSARKKITVTEFALDDLHPNLNNNQEITKILLRKEVSLKIKNPLKSKKKKA